MNLSRTLPSALIGFLVATVSFAADMGTGGPGCSGALNQDQRLMLFVEMHQATANMTKDQKKDYRRAERDKIKAMSPAERQKFAADLEAKWDALPAERKANIQEKAQAARSKHPMMAHMMGTSC